MNSTYDPLVGRVLDDRYEILAKLARGGMATVYRARDRRLNRTVAVKVMRPDLGEDDEFTAKFDREARSAATLSHPAVVGVFDQGMSDGRPYIVMEFVEGETLRRMLSREAPLPPADAFELLEPIASALAAAHDAGIVHRDIKPENVLISTRGRVKVADFGLARSTSSPQMTATGVLVGTASYLPPELVTHSRPDSRSDVYSAGIVAFEMLTGSKPHTGENNYQIAYRHVNVDIVAPSVRFEEAGHRGWRIPDYVDAFVQACTTRDPAVRIPDGRAMLQQLRLVRAALARDPGRDDPELAAHLRPPRTPDAEVTMPLGPQPIPRPRPLPPGEPASPTEASPASWSPVTATPPPAPPGRAPVAPEPSAAPGPAGPRTPVFPHLHVSADPVHRRRRGLATLLLVVLLTIGAGYGSWWLLAGRYTAVPTVQGTTEVDALAAVEANDLRPERATEYSEEVARDIVIRTDPDGGRRVLRGSEVTIVVSLGPERFDMPAVVGKSLEQARALLAEQNLVVGAVTESWSEAVAAGLVIGASQPEGTPLKRNTAIDLEVSKGPQPIPVVDHTGRDAAAAKKELEDAGFKVTMTEENSDTVPKGMVITQTPASGTAFKGDEIKLVASLGPVMVEVPNVRLKSRREAEEILKGLGFTVKVTQNAGFPLPLDIATGTRPEAGKLAPKGSEVELFVS